MAWRENGGSIENKKKSERKAAKSAKKAQREMKAGENNNGGM